MGARESPIGTTAPATSGEKDPEMLRLTSKRGTTGPSTWATGSLVRAALLKRRNPIGNSERGNIEKKMQVTHRRRKAARAAE